MEEQQLLQLEATLYALRRPVSFS